MLSDEIGTVLKSASRAAGIEDSLTEIASAIATVTNDLVVEFLLLDHLVPGLRLVGTYDRELSLTYLDVSTEYIGFSGTFNVDDVTPAQFRQLCQGQKWVLPVYSDVGLAGAIAFDEPLSRSSAETVVQLSSGLIPIFEQILISRLLSEMQRPIDYMADQQSFYSQLVALVERASAMEFVAIRDIEALEYTCVAQSGFDKAVGTEKLLEDLSYAIGEVPIFDEVATKPDVKQCSSLSLNSELSGELTRSPHLRLVSSFVVVPIKVGTKTTGLLSLGSKLSGTFTGQQLLAFSALANSVGVSMENFKNFHATATDLAQLSEVGVAITAIEVAQSARHEAKALVGNIGSNVSTIKRLANGKDSESIKEAANRISSISSEVNGALEKIKAATKPPLQELESVSINEVWEKAKGQVISKLADQKISAEIQGADVVVEAYPEWLRHVFLNLLLNSAEAFATRGRKGNRKIRLRITDLGETTGTVVMRYTDSAGGIRDADFAATDNPLELPTERLIFEPDVTSKEEGSGWGLFLVRQILARHAGNIDVVSLKMDGGITFDLELPLTQDSD